MIRTLAAALSIVLAPVSAQQTPRSIRIRGHRGIAPLVKAWEEAFRKHQPGITFDTQLRGNASAIGGVYTGAADIAIMGREIWPIEVEGYDQALGAKPVPIAIANGKALAIFVHKDNPIARLSLAQLDAIFGADHRRGPANITTWRDLGGDNQPIHLYGYGLARDTSQFFQQAVFLGSQKWNCNLHEMQDGQAILDALSKDRYGIAISSQTDQNPFTKSVALGAKEGYYQPTKAAIVAHQYPLARELWVFIGRPVHPQVEAFLEFVLSREGQDIVTRDGGYLPLSAASLLDERKKLP